MTEINIGYVNDVAFSHDHQTMRVRCGDCGGKDIRWNSTASHHYCKDCARVLLVTYVPHSTAIDFDRGEAAVEVFVCLWAKDHVGAIKVEVSWD